jgi:archaemetzincin
MDEGTTAAGSPFVSTIYVAPEQIVETTVLDDLETSLESSFSLPVRRLPPFADPDFAFDAQRSQYNSTEILRWLADHRPPGPSSLLGIVDRDIFIPMLTFVFGQAQLGGRLALVSLARLRQECYGLPADPQLLLTRARKETIHELGHTFGLIHCRDTHCVMSLSISIEQVDVKETAFCSACRRLLHDRLDAPPGGGGAW